MPEPTDDVLNLLIEDHREAERQLEQFADADRAQRRDMFAPLTAALVKHEVAEEVAVYPVVIDEVPGGGAVADARIAEQSEAERLLSEMEKMDPTSEEFAASFTELKISVLEHARAEEAEVFPLLREHLSAERRMEIGERYAKVKASAPTHPHPNAPDNAPANKLGLPVLALADRIRDAARRL